MVIHTKLDLGDEIKFTSYHNYPPQKATGVVRRIAAYRHPDYSNPNGYEVRYTIDYHDGEHWCQTDVWECDIDECLTPNR